MLPENINYAGHLFKLNGKPKLWEELKNKFNFRANYCLSITKYYILLQNHRRTCL